MDPNRRRHIERFAAVPFPLMESDAWRSASHAARALFLEYLHRYTGLNNGRIHVTFLMVGPPPPRGEGAGLFAARGRFYRAVDELWGRGLVQLVQEGDFGAARKAHSWAVCTRDLDVPGYGVPFERSAWKRWTPDVPCLNWIHWRGPNGLISRKREHQRRRTTNHTDRSRQRTVSVP